MEGSAIRFALVLGGNRPSESEFRIGAPHLALPVPRRRAEVHMLVPLGDAQRNTLIELILTKALRSRVHHPNQLVALALLLVQQRRRMLGIETKCRLESVAVVGEVILLLRKIGQKNLEAVVERRMVILILLGNSTGGLDDAHSFFVVAGL